MMPIIMDDQILECKEQGIQFASDNSNWIESVGQHSSLTVLVYLWYALSATTTKTKNKNPKNPNNNRFKQKHENTPF